VKSFSYSRTFPSSWIDHIRFYGTSFNSDISFFDVSSVTDFSYMVRGLVSLCRCTYFAPKPSTYVSFPLWFVVLRQQRVQWKFDCLGDQLNGIRR